MTVTIAAQAISGTNQFTLLPAAADGSASSVNQGAAGATTFAVGSAYSMTVTVKDRFGNVRNRGPCAQAGDSGCDEISAIFGISSSSCGGPGQSAVASVAPDVSGGSFVGDYTLSFSAGQLALAGSWADATITVGGSDVPGVTGLTVNALGKDATTTSMGNDVPKLTKIIAGIEGKFEIHPRDQFRNCITATSDFTPQNIAFVWKPSANPGRSVSWTFCERCVHHGHEPVLIYLSFSLLRTGTYRDRPRLSLRGKKERRDGHFGNDKRDGVCCQVHATRRWDLRAGH